MWAIVESDEVRVERTRYEVPGWGVGELWTSGRLVHAHDFDFHASSKDLARVVATSSRETSTDAAPRHPEAPLDPRELVQRFEAFLAGDDVPLDDVPLDLRSCTPFQRAVATALRTVPRGEAVSYGELAALAGYPGAQRAAGTFCARNRFALLVPCHRVVGAAGIGSYGSAGVAVKRRLLALEGVVL
jgi:methylated-DNA-[protein]-cysteine S-methyltransferase